MISIMSKFFLFPMYGFICSEFPIRRELNLISFSFIGHIHNPCGKEFLNPLAYTIEAEGL